MTYQTGNKPLFVHMKTRFTASTMLHTTFQSCQVYLLTEGFRLLIIVEVPIWVHNHVNTPVFPTIIYTLKLSLSHIYANSAGKEM